MLESWLLYSKLARTSRLSQQIQHDATFNLAVFSEGHSKDVKAQKISHHSYSTCIRNHREMWSYLDGHKVVSVILFHTQTRTETWSDVDGYKVL